MPGRLAEHYQDKPCGGKGNTGGDQTGQRKICHARLYPNQQSTQRRSGHKAQAKGSAQAAHGAGQAIGVGNIHHISLGHRDIAGHRAAQGTGGE